MKIKSFLGIFIFFFLCIFFFSCTSSKSYNATTVGEIEGLIKKGDMTQHIALSQIKNVSHVYALGSVTGLKGFIVVDDNKPYTSYVQHDSIVIDSSWKPTATLLVYSQVENWKEIAIPASITSWTQLEKFIGDEAKQEKFNPDIAFPFLLKGTAAALSWRVSDWNTGDQEITNKKVKSSGLKGAAQQVSATMVGFYCTKQYRVLAEHDTKMHIHFVSDDRKVSGHIDDLTLDGRLRLYLPLDSGAK